MSVKSLSSCLFKIFFLLACAFVAPWSTSGSTVYVSPSGFPISPYTNWTTAATNIQDAVAVAVAGDTVLVDDGVYSSGGAVTPAGILTNRVRATNAIVIQSVNGPASTTIMGQGPRGSNAVRGVYLSGGARMIGFTIASGATMTGGTFPIDQNGAGAYCIGGSSISNCVVKNNSGYEGGGLYIFTSGNAYHCTIESNQAAAGAGIRFSDAGTSVVRNCRIVRNTAPQAGGVHIYHTGRLQNCLIADNVATQSAGGVFVDGGASGAYIENCTIAGNSAPLNGGIGHVASGPLVRNSIIYGNSSNNWTAGTFINCDTTPLPSGAGNKTNDPLFADAQYRIAAGSPCVDAGSNGYAVGTVDLDGNARIINGRVDLGAYEVVVTGLVVSVPSTPSGPSAGGVNVALSYTSGNSTSSDGSAVEYHFDWGDGNLSSWGSASNSHAWTNTGVFQVQAQARCATNQSAVSGWSDALSVTITSPPLPALTHYVAAAGSATYPYTNWATAANNIQDAVAIVVAGGTVIVTDGTYSAGSALTPGYVLPNRVRATNAVTIQSVNGPAVTTILGQGPRGSNAVRAVYLGGGAQMIGFTIAGGATMTGGTFPYDQNGGGVYCIGGSSISNCVVKDNAGYEGGGIYILTSGNVYNSLIASNQAAGGGGVRFSDAGNSVVRNCRIVGNSGPHAAGVHIYHSGRLQNCLIAGNVATQNTGGVFADAGGSGAYIENCTITGNSAPLYGGIGHVVSGPFVRNSIVYGNSGGNWSAGSFLYSDTAPLPSGAGNKTNDPLFIDGDYRIGSGSPCVDAGTNAYAAGSADLDGNARIINGRVDMGAYEVVATGAFVSVPSTPSGPSAGGVNVALSYTSGSSTSSDGSAVEYHFDWGDGNLSSWGSETNSHAWVNTGAFQVRAQARCVTNQSAVSGWSDALSVTITSPPLPALTHYVAAAGSATYPYTNWATAANNIQDAVAIAVAGGTVIVTDGTYSAGSALTPGYVLPNRVRVTNAITIQSVNGPAVTTILGQGPRGSNAVRAVYLGGGAQMIGFTIAGGATMTGGTFPYDQNGGGVYCIGGSSISNCVVKDNAGYEGGGIYILTSGNVYNSLIASNQAAGGGGVRFSDAGNSVVRNCRIVGNSGPHAAGVHIYHSGRLQNCLIAGNVATQNTGGVYVDWGSQGAIIENCTIAGNSAPVSGGLGYVINGATVRNSIIYANSNGNWSGGSYTYCDTTPLPGGTGNLAVDPLFADGEYRIGAGSPCINAGANAYAAGSADLDGNDRIVNGTVDMGAYESIAGGATVSTPSTPSGSATGQVNEVMEFVSGGSTCSDGGAVEYRFDWGDGSLSTWGSGTDYHAWANAGAYSIRAQARCVTNTVVASGWSAAKGVVILAPPPVSTVHYVSKSGVPVSPYTNWATAALRIQDAINVSIDGDTVIVGHGVFQESVDFLGKDIEVGSLYRSTGDDSDIALTVIDGGATGRVVTFQGGESAAALLSGFTITNGHAIGGLPTGYGGGVACFSSSPRLENLVVVGNDADAEGGGIYLSHSSAALRDVIVRQNTAINGGGIRISYGLPSLMNIVAEDNSTVDGGAGMQFYHADASVRNALIKGNTTAGDGGGLFFDGASPSLVNVTIAGNTSPAARGGGLSISYSSHPRLVNAIVWGNTGEQIVFHTRWFGMAVTIEYSDIQGGSTGVLTSGLGPVNWLGGNTNADPQFVGGGDDHLQPGSLCVGAGTNQAWMLTDTDLDGNARIFNGTVDMGAYEVTTNGSPVTGGSITCVIEPQEAVDVGARWRLAGQSNWLESGQTIYVPTGSYTVTFSSLASWTAPADKPATVGPGSDVSISAVYAPLQADDAPPVIVHIAPPDGHISNGNQIPMTILATDNVDVVSVTVNGHAATESGPHTFHYTLTGVRGTYNSVVIVAVDALGNSAIDVINYGQGNSLQLAALWDGYWRVRNPFSNDVSYTWEVYGATNEHGSGVAAANRDSNFNTSLGPKTVVLRVDGIIVDTKPSSTLPPPAEVTNEGDLDSDEDGNSNWQEDYAGTDPNNATSVLDVVVTRTVPEGGAGRPGDDEGGAAGGPGGADNEELVFSWQSGVNSMYTAETSTNLENWTISPSFEDVIGTGDVMSYTNQAGGESELYIRIKAEKRP